MLVNHKHQGGPPVRVKNITMLLDLEITIKITNDGKHNLVSVKCPADALFIHSLTGLKLAIGAQEKSLHEYVKKRAPITSDELSEIMNKRTCFEITMD